MRGVEVLLSVTTASVSPGSRHAVCRNGGGASVPVSRSPEKKKRVISRPRHHVGDMATRRRGVLYLTDRANNMIITGGVNIYPAESSLLGPSRGLRGVGVPDDEWENQ